ncbi:hypothetical protein A2U01_0096754, partial [Trifolium medium]|nr:hypothetical protein [Trifolium medium]
MVMLTLGFVLGIPLSHALPTTLHPMLCSPTIFPPPALLGSLTLGPLSMSPTALRTFSSKFPLK